MSDHPRQTLLEELDARQNELLDELDRLNLRIEQVLHDCLAWRGPAPRRCRPSLCNAPDSGVFVRVHVLIAVEANLTDERRSSICSSISPLLPGDRSPARHVRVNLARRISKNRSAAVNWWLSRRRR